MYDLARTLLTISCTDCASIPKVPNAGTIVVEDGQPWQLMHNGLKVAAGAYHGDWMAHIIRSLRGHHEPQEELVYSEIIRRAKHNSLIVELGSFWSYYSMWFVKDVPGSTAVCVEPDGFNLTVGVRNAAANELANRLRFINAAIGDSSRPISLECETERVTKTIKCLDMKALIDTINGQSIEVLHIDAQGAELGFLTSMRGGGQLANYVRFAVISTHHHSISGSTTTHSDCISILRQLGAHVLVEHSVEESFSGDGLIVASFQEIDSRFKMPKISKNSADKNLWLER